MIYENVLKRKDKKIIKHLLISLSGHTYLVILGRYKHALDRTQSQYKQFRIVHEALLGLLRQFMLEIIKEF